MTKNTLIETGAFVSLSAGFYIVAPYTISIIERFITVGLSGLTIIAAHSILAAAMLKLYFKFFPLEKVEPETSEIIELIKGNPERFKEVLEQEFKKKKKATK